MELKNYQKQILNDIDNFLQKLSMSYDLQKAFNDFWEEKGFTVGFGGMAPYQDVISGVPNICLKVPTGGGKTFIATASIKTIFNHYKFAKGKLVLWLCPTSAILEQTVKNLKNVNHPYRQRLNTDFNSKVVVLEKKELLNGFNFSPTILAENLVVCVMSYDSLRIANQNKEQRKIYQDNGQMLEFDTINSETNLEDTDDTALINVMRNYCPLLIVDESHNADSELSIEMIKRTNPSMVLELTATPKKTSNVISYVSAIELKNEEMVKLPVFLYKFKCAKEVIMNAIRLQSNLENEAKLLKNENGKYIRPIVLFQAEGKFDDNRETFEKIEKVLVKDLSIDESKVAIKTGEINELENKDLLSEECPIRYIITINALKEGWDCPFAYILASVSNRNSATDVEQIIGRVLRQPYVEKTKYEGLNISYVLTCSDDFSNTANSVIEGLEHAGYSKKDVRIEIKDHESKESIDGTQNNGVETGISINEDGTIDFEKLFNIEENKITSKEKNEVLAIFDEASNVGDETKQLKDEKMQEIEKLESELKEKLAEYNKLTGSDITKTNGVPMDKTYISTINEEYVKDIEELKLPMFVEEMDIPIGEIKDNFVKFDKEHLNSTFNLNNCDCNINFSFDDNDIQKIDLNEKGVIKTNYVSKNEKELIRKMIFSQMPVKQRMMLTETIASIINNKDNTISIQDITKYVARILSSRKDEDISDIFNNIEIYTEKIIEKIKQLKFKYYCEEFNKRINTGEIKVLEKYTMQNNIVLQNNNILTKYNKCLFTAEKNDLNKKEEEIISIISSYDNILWWHRNIDRLGFYINGFLNTYPDFIIKTKKGKIIMLETKGDDRDNSDSALKLELGTKWALMAGDKYRYFMVFDKKEDAIQGSYSKDEFLNMIKNL